jgi:TonB dependent receptor
VRSAAPSPLIAEALVPAGTGRTVGAEFLLRCDPTGGFFGWIAYTLSRSERVDGPGQPVRLFDFDQTHVLTALGSYDLGAGFDIGLRVRAASGFPRTAVDGRFYDARSDRYEPALGKKNGIRLPMFLQLDARAAKRFAIATTELEIYLDVQNVTNRPNAEEFAYSTDYHDREVISGLPILPLIGAEWRF